jgi:undecaprenyl-diphosphatase
LSLHGAISALPGNLLGMISERDHRLMRRMNRWRAPRWVQFLMLGASRAGDGWFWVALGLGLIILGGPRRFAATSAGCLASGTGLGIYLILKKLTGRKRPCLIDPHHWAQILPPDQYSFPSGHTITAFAIATALGLFYPSLFSVLLPCAVLIGISRIVLGMHFLSDVVAGALIGSLLGYAAFVVMA